MIIIGSKISPDMDFNKHIPGLIHQPAHHRLFLTVNKTQSDIKLQSLFALYLTYTSKISD